MNDDVQDERGDSRPDGDEAPAIYSVGHTDGQVVMNRRSFLEIAGVAAGAAALLKPSRLLASQDSDTNDSSLARAHEEAVTALAVRSDGKLLASADQGGTIKLWQLPEGGLLHSWKGSSGRVSALFFPRAKDSLWSRDSGGRIACWPLPQGSTTISTRSVIADRPVAVPSGADWYAFGGGDDTLWAAPACCASKKLSTNTSAMEHSGIGSHAGFA